MGVVYVARQRSPERRVALKLITPAFANDEVFRRRFLREATAAAAIEHPHILPVYAAGESNGTLFMAMRLIDGRDLRAILRDRRSFRSSGSKRIVGQVGGALDAAHARGLVHRDVKPGNVLVAEQSDAEEADFCYLMDFGVSTWTASSAATITATGQMVGTANYMAPEQIEGEGSTDAPTSTRWGACCTNASRAAHRSAVGALPRSCTATSMSRRRHRAPSARGSHLTWMRSSTARSGRRRRSATPRAASCHRTSTPRSPARPRRCRRSSTVAASSGSPSADDREGVGHGSRWRRSRRRSSWWWLASRIWIPRRRAAGWVAAGHASAVDP